MAAKPVLWLLLPLLLFWCLSLATLGSETDLAAKEVAGSQEIEAAGKIAQT